MDEQDEKLEAGEIVVQNKFTQWFENFWYHYKWHTIIISFFAVVLGVCLVQCATTPRPEALVVYAGGYTLSGSEAEEIDKLLTQMMPANKDGSGNDASLNAYSIYNAAELLEKCTDPETGNKDTYAYATANAVNQDHIKGFSDFVMTGSSAVWFVSESIYDTHEEDATRGEESDGLSLVSKDRLVPLPELGVSEALAYDAYAVRLADTEFYRHYAVMQILPEDTLMVFSRQMVMGAIADDENYAMQRELFLAIVNYKAS